MDLLRATRRELGLFGCAGVLFAAAVLFEPYNTERPYTFEKSEKVQRDHLSLSERLGYAILLRAGYATASLVPDFPTEGEETEEEKDRPTQDMHLELTFQEGHPDLKCLDESPDLELPGKGKLYLRELTVAILAAEKYNRSALQRTLEDGLARASLRLRDRLPDFSYGLGQIRPETARRLLKAELGDFQLPDRDLREILVDPCYNVRLTAQYVDSLVRRFAAAPTIDEILSKVALEYSGSVTPTINGLRYVDAVSGAYHLLTWKTRMMEEMEAEGEISEPQGPVVSCTYFAAGAVNGSVVEDMLLAREGDERDMAEREVRIYFAHQEGGPRTYARLLADRRRNWLVNRLVDLGFALNRISVIESDLPAPVIRSCAEDTPLTWAGIDAGQFMPPPPPSAAP